MTDVLGPPGPVERFSSLPICGRNGSVADAAFGSEMEVICDMAWGNWHGHLTQAFDIPWETRKAASGANPAGAIRSFSFFSPGRVFQPAQPSGSMVLEYGSVTCLSQARHRQSHGPEAGSIPDPAIASD